MQQQQLHLTASPPLKCHFLLPAHMLSFFFFFLLTVLLAPSSSSGIMLVSICPFPLFHPISTLDCQDALILTLIHKFSVRPIKIPERIFVDIQKKLFYILYRKAKESE